MAKEKPWTDLQIYCYNRNCNCYNCPAYVKLESVTSCQVKKSIRKYILEHGVPPEVKMKGIIDEEDI